MFDERQEPKESRNGISYFLLKLEVISDITNGERVTKRILLGASKGKNRFDKEYNRSKKLFSDEVKHAEILTWATYFLLQKIQSFS